MTIIESAVLGIVQGLTEFIPVSSSGHLVIGQYFFTGASDHLFIEFINIGTVLALLIYFRQRIIGALKDIFVRHNFKLLINILITAVPAGIVGLLLADFIAHNSFFGNVWVVVVTLAVVGVAMIILEKLPKKSPVQEQEDLPKSRALIIGLAQVLSLIPGVSRSGSTMIAGRLMGLNAAKAAEYSFLVSIPIMLGVIAKLFLKEADRAYFFDNLLPLVVGNIAALVSGLLAVGFLMRYLAKNDLKLFGWYRIGLALVLTVILLVQ
ncbi:MAG TPA: undecaprenyl-diphosphate phosphatase [Candidatus Saccharimonadales bacterium]